MAKLAFIQEIEQQFHEVSHQVSNRSDLSSAMPNFHV